MKKANGYWNYEKCYEIAKQYKTKGEFARNSSGAYSAALRHKWMDDYYWFVDGRVKKYTDKNDSVYKYVFEDGAIYIGRTLISQQKNRKNKHSTSEKDTVFKYAKENGLAIPPMEIIEEKITPIEGLQREDYWVNYYKEKGYNVINKAKTGIGCGSLGRINYGKWNKEAVFKEGQKYKTKSEFKQNAPSAYASARKKGWLKEMDWFNGNKHWDKEASYKEALKYSTRNDFQKGCQSAYDKARRKGWLDDYTWFKESHKQKPNGYWDIFENVEKETKKYKTRYELKKGSCGAYDAARKNNWLNILFPKKAA